VTCGEADRLFRVLSFRASLFGDTYRALAASVLHFLALEARAPPNFVLPSRPVPTFLGHPFLWPGCSAESGPVHPVGPFSPPFLFELFFHPPTRCFPWPRGHSSCLRGFFLLGTRTIFVLWRWLFPRLLMAYPNLPPPDGPPFFVAWAFPF